MAVNKLTLYGDEFFFAPAPATQIDAVVLAANTAETYTIPTGARFLLFSADGDFYVRYAGTAAIPAADITNGSGSELNPAMRYVKSLSSISIIAPLDTIVTVCAYA